MPLPVVLIPLAEGIVAFFESRLVTMLGARLGAAVSEIVLPFIRQVMVFIVGDAGYHVIVEGGVNNAIVAIAREKLNLELDSTDPLGRPSIIHAISIRMGVELDPDNPFTPQSITNAMARKVGLDFHIRDITNRAMLLEDLQAPIVQQLNTRLGTTFSHFYPVDETLMDDFRSQFTVQFERALAGQASMLNTQTVQLIKTRLETSVGVLVPKTLAESQKAILAREYSRRYYDRLVKSGYKRGWVKA
jgi:hypothetical protein